MRKTLLIIALGITYSGLTYGQKVQIPISRQGFHDNIDKEQAAADKFDSKQDSFVKVSDDESMSLQVTNALLKQVDDIQNENRAGYRAGPPFEGKIPFRPAADPQRLQYQKELSKE